MFSVATTSEAGFDKVVLEDMNNATRVEIIPSCGGILHHFSVVSGDIRLNIIDHYESAIDFRQNVTDKGFKSCKLSPFACRINNARYSFAGEKYTTTKFLLNESALHGLLYDAAFTVTAVEALDHEASVTMLHQYNGSEAGYPFPYDCRVTFNLQHNHSLSITTLIKNTSAGWIPLQDGWHPYFCFGGSIDDLQLEFQSNEAVVFNSAMIPTGETIPYQEFGSLKKLGSQVFDDCFTVNFAECQPMCVLRDPAQKIQVEIRPGKSYPYLQVYTPPHRKSIALENLSAAPDCFNNGMGLITLQSGGEQVFTTNYTIRLL